MAAISEFLKVLISEDQMYATIRLLEPYEPNQFTEEKIREWLKTEKVVFGIDEKILKEIATTFNEKLFPARIASGFLAEHGIDGQIDFVCDREDSFTADEKQSFRDVMKIPAVAEGEKIAQITLPTDGKPGMNVSGKELKNKKGKPVRYIPGKNVKYIDDDLAFYSEHVGKLSVGGNKINVFDTYEISEDLSMKTGNIKFQGSVVIRGNVPTGYEVIADGDIQINGLVEASLIKAGGSVTITEGIAGLQKGKVIAAHNVNVGYINQAIIEAGQNIIVKNSIMHSECLANGHIYCESGNIIGGVCSAGITIEVKDVGNKMDTKTEIAIGVNQKAFLLEEKLLQARETLEEEVKKLKALGVGLERKAKLSNGLSSKERILLLKQKNTLQVTEKKLEKINQQITDLNVGLGDEEKARLLVKGTLYPNVSLSYGKYQHTTTKNYKFTQVFIEDGEIKIEPL